MPTIQINYGYFLELGSLPFPLMLARLFLDGGWVLFLYFFIRGSWVLWVQSRQRKYAKTVSKTILAIDVPRQNEQTAKAVEQIFSQLSGAHSGLDRYEKYWLGKFQPTFSFEIASVGGYVQFLVHCPTKFRDLVESAVYAQYPDAEIVEVADYTDRLPTRYPHPEFDVFGSEFVLKKPSYFPIRTHIQFEHAVAEDPFKDPISGILEVLSSLKAGENIWIQFLLTPTDDSWKDPGEKEVDKMLGKAPKSKRTIVDDIIDIPLNVLQELGSVVSFGESDAKKKDEKKEEFKMLNMSPGERQVVEQVQMKLSKIAFSTKVRFVYGARRDVFNKGRVTALKGAFSQFSSLNMNQFKNYGKVTPKGDYFWQRWSEPAKKTAIVAKFKSRSNEGAPGYFLNVEELATVYHFPMRQVKAPLVKKTEAKRAEPPAGLPVEGLEDSSPFGPPPKPPAPEGEAAPPKDLPLA